MIKLQTLKSKDGKYVVHGRIIHWHDNDSFQFVPSGHKLSQSWWCKLDYWDLIEGIPVIYKVSVKKV